MKKAVGRPRLDGQSSAGKSATLRVAVPDVLRLTVDRAAREFGMTTSEATRQALESWLQTHGITPPISPPAIALRPVLLKRTEPSWGTFGGSSGKIDSFFADSGREVVVCQWGCTPGPYGEDQALANSVEWLIGKFNELYADNWRWADTEPTRRLIENYEYWSRVFTGEAQMLPPGYKRTVPLL